ncbi:MAG: hypothetical protein M1818_001680 [Claussenomyces sp. TS43310]|nr:MAG: hypothetical protein M1818_001680 [Claussenomyces sp. TS43310]
MTGKTVSTASDHASCRRDPDSSGTVTLQKLKPSSYPSRTSSDDELDPDAAFVRRHFEDSDEDDDGGDYTHNSPFTFQFHPFRSFRSIMSKAPLLLRSSPGFGTGSYGAAPVGALVESSDEENTTIVKGRGKRQVGSKLRGAAGERGRTSRKPSDARSVTTAANIRLRRSTSSPTSRRNTGPSASEQVLPLNEGAGLAGRYGAGGLLADPVFDDSSSEGGSDIREETVDDEDPPDNSRYAQVRASVSAIDDTTLSINTPRMWTLSMMFAIIGSATNLFFSLRYPSVSITPVIALLLAHPLGILWDRILKRKDDPKEVFINGVLSYSSPKTMDSAGHSLSDAESDSALTEPLSWRRWLAQGRWNEKEHSCVYISSNVSFGFAFATDVIIEQTRFYKQEVSITYQILLILSTQILGYSFAGLARRFIVRPGGMIWPGTLMSAAMFTTLHKEENTVANGWRLTRWKFFLIVWTSAFLFYFLPGLLMPALSYFSIITWFAPKNVVIANLFGVASGLGLFPLTFDWAQIAYIGSPLLTPFWAAMNVVGGLVIVMWIIAPIAYYNNVFFSSYMPILSSAVFDNTGKVYDVSKILTPDFVFDREAYQKYSRVYLPITYVLSYGLQFAALASLLTHTFCWHGKDIWRQWKRSLREVEGQKKTGYEAVPRNGARIDRADSNMDDIIGQEDVHNRLMKKYQDAPLTWYLITCVSMTAIGIFVVEFYDVHLPWYGLLLALGICAVLFIPIGIVMAITNQHSSIYLICQLVCGAVFPGRPVANMVFVTYGYISSAQGIKFCSDLKLGHYMKIPPRLLFSVQMVATIISSLTQIGVLNWMFAYVPNICTAEAINGFSCPIARVHFNGSILWGVVGPKEFFGPNGTYRPLVWCFLVGAIAPVILWFYARNRKPSIVRKINLPVLFGSLSWIPPATGLNFSVWALVCYLFNYLIKNRASAWWAKYTMTLSAALDSGLAFGLVVIFFGFLYPGWMDGFKWWGTEIYKQGCDWQACAYREVPAGQHFGPDTW